MSENRAAARAMAAQAVDRGEPLGWFEELYVAADKGQASVPWADLTVNPHLASWCTSAPTAGSRALVVGCGLGDDAEWLAGNGYQVTAFDISATAVAACQKRFPESPVDYVQADLLSLPEHWRSDPFDLVVEIYTVQVLPPASAERSAAFEALSAVTGETLLVIARGRANGEDPGAMPWPLTRSEMDTFCCHGLIEGAFDDFIDHEDPPVRRFRGLYTRTKVG